MKPKRHPPFALALFLVVSSASAQTIVLWNFNSSPSDSNAATGTLSPVIGAGTITAVGGTAIQSSYRDASLFGGSSDPAATDDSALNIAGFAAQGTGNDTRGVQFAVSTVGYSDISFTFDQHRGQTSSAYVRVEYSLDGSTFAQMSLSDAGTSGGLVFASYPVEGAGNTWLNGFTVDLSSLVGVSNNPTFEIRLLAEFQPSTSTYSPASTLSVYSTAVSDNYWAFDEVKFTGTPIPEPPVYATLIGFAGLVAAGWRYRQGKRRAQSVPVHSI